MATPPANITKTMHPDLAATDTAPPPLPPWLKGFLVTSTNSSNVRRAGEEVAQLLNDFWFQVAYNTGLAEGHVPFERAESLLVPGSPGACFVALKPDNNDMSPVLLATDIMQEVEKGEGWTRTQHVARIIPVEGIVPEGEWKELAKLITNKHFPAKPIAPAAGHPLPTYRVHYEEHSPATHMHSKDVAETVAGMVPTDCYKVNLKEADRTILCVVAGGSAMMSVVQGYDKKLHHFRVHPVIHTPTTPSA